MIRVLQIAREIEKRDRRIYVVMGIGIAAIALPFYGWDVFWQVELTWLVVAFGMMAANVALRMWRDSDPRA